MTKEELLQQRQALEDQRTRAIVNMHQAAGAIAMIDLIVAKMAEPQPEPLSEEQLKRALGADSLTVVGGTATE